MPAKDRKLTLAIDLGATNLRVGFVALEDGQATIVDQIKDRSIAFDQPALEKQIVSMAKEMAAKHPEIEFTTVGISACGMIENDRVAVLLPNLGVHDSRLADLIEESFPGTRCLVANDANCAALSESTMGAAKDVSDSIFLTISSGIGIGYVYRHSLVNIPLECGHLVIDIEGIGLCEVEQYLSGNGIARLCAAKGLGELSAAEFFDRVRKQDPEALEVYHLWIKNLGMFIGNLQRTFSCDLFVLSGGVLKSQDVFLSDLEKVANGFVHPYPLKPVKFKEALFSQDAGLMGGAALGFSLIK